MDKTKVKVYLTSLFKISDIPLSAINIIICYLIRSHMCANVILVTVSLVFEYTQTSNTYLLIMLILKDNFANS